MKFADLDAIKMSVDSYYIASFVLGLAWKWYGNEDEKTENEIVTETHGYAQRRVSVRMRKRGGAD